MVDSPESKMRSPDRILSLTPIDGKKALDSAGLVDTRLFTGENQLHAKMNTETTLWSFHYDQGGLPQPLKSQFTSFSTLLRFAEDYFGKRNIRIKQIKD